jgi:hypothetical protein
MAEILPAHWKLCCREIQRSDGVALNIKPDHTNLITTAQAFSCARSLQKQVVHLADDLSVSHEQVDHGANILFCGSALSGSIAAVAYWWVKVN